MNKKTLALIKPAIVLTVICMAAAILLAVVNRFTAPEIERVEREKQLATLSVVLPEAKGFEQVSAKNAPKTVTAVYMETSGKGYALLCSTETGFGTLSFSIGIDAEGKIAGIKLTSVFYSAGDSGKEKGIAALIDSYKGQTDTENGIPVSGATLSSNAMKAAIADALNYVNTLQGGK